MDSRLMFGRRVIYTDESEITRKNIVGVLNKAMAVHYSNRSEIQYLYDYYRGKQPILGRTKDIRPEINNKLIENRANEIVSFKVGYLMGEPIQYVNRSGNETATDGINRLNEFVFAEDKSTKDKELADWFTICGTAFRMVIPDSLGDEPDEAPFEIYTLDPRDAFVVYFNGLGNKPVMGVKYIVKEDSTIVYSVYTDKMYFEVAGDSIVKAQPHSLGSIPIIEYPANSARLGAFEIVLSLLDSINEIGSNRLDGIEQFVQALLMFKGVDVDADDFDTLREKGGIKVPLEGDVKYLVQELNQTQTQTLVDYMYQTVLTICGMPNRNGGSSTSDTGSAVIMRDGWSAAEARAKDTELMFKMSEKQFLKLAIRITNDLKNMGLKLADIEIRFTRRNYENIQEKTQVLTTMLSNDKIHPQLAFEHCGLFIDPEIAYTKSMKYAEEREEELAKELEKNPPVEDDTEKGKETEDDV
jgi:SPP1 family phage portal protein